MDYIARFAEGQIRKALEITPVVIISGPRQSGKSTLAQQITNGEWRYLNLDDPSILSAAVADPTSLFQEYQIKVIIDEIQRAPNLLLNIKMAVDQARQPGKLLSGMFLLTGSANLLSLPRLSDSLAGRSKVVQLFPISQSELSGSKPSFVEDILHGKFPEPSRSVSHKEMIDIALSGGFPEAILLTKLAQKQSWHLNYLNAILQRDIKDVTTIRKASELPKLISLLATYSGNLVNLEDIGRRLRLGGKTVDSYITALEQIFLVRRLRPWHNNPAKRLVKQPKLFFYDSGLLASELNLSYAKLGADTLGDGREKMGPLIETFVFSELVKQLGWSSERIELSFYRDSYKNEVDFVLENKDAEIVGVEVKSGSTVSVQDFKGLRKLKNILEPDSENMPNNTSTPDTSHPGTGDPSTNHPNTSTPTASQNNPSSRNSDTRTPAKRFKLGVVLYTGKDVLPFGERLYALPMSCLWS